MPAQFAGTKNDPICIIRRSARFKELIGATRIVTPVSTSAAATGRLAQPARCDDARRVEWRCDHVDVRRRRRRHVDGCCERGGRGRPHLDRDVEWMRVHPATSDTASSTDSRVELSNPSTELQADRQHDHLRRRGLRTPAVSPNIAEAGVFQHLAGCPRSWTGAAGEVARRHSDARSGLWWPLSPWRGTSRDYRPESSPAVYLDGMSNRLWDTVAPSWREQRIGRRRALVRRPAVGAGAGRRHLPAHQARRRDLQRSPAAGGHGPPRPFVADRARRDQDRARHPRPRGSPQPVRPASAILAAQDIADAILYVVTRPRHVAINEILIRPTD